MKPQTFLRRITTFLMSVVLFSTFFFPLTSQPAWANQATTMAVRNSAQPSCTAESRALGKSECNVNIDDRDTFYDNSVKIDNSVRIDARPVPNNNDTTGALLGGAALGAMTGGAASVMAVSGAGSVAGLSAAGISSGLAAVGGVVGGGMAAGLVVSAALPVVTTVGVGLAAYQGLKALTSHRNNNKQKADQNQQ